MCELRPRGSARAFLWLQLALCEFHILNSITFLKFQPKINALKHLVLLTVFICLVLRGFSQNNPLPTVQGLPLSIDERVDGLGNRSTLIKHLCELDSDFVFKRIKDVDGQHDYYANDSYNTSVEIIGEENNLVMIQWTFRMIPNNSPATHLEINRMGGFARGIGGKDGFDWLSNIYLKFKDKPLTGYSETKQLYLGRVAKFVYSPQLRKMTLTITIKAPIVEELIVSDMKGLGDRAGLIRYIRSADSDFVFKRRGDIDGKPDYYASDRYSTSVELTGNDDEIIMVKWTMSFVSGNEPANKQELDRMSYMEMLMGDMKDREWFPNFYKKIIGNPNEGYTETKEFAQMRKIAVLKYNPQLRNMTLTVTVKEDK